MFQATGKSFADRVLAGQTNVRDLPGAAAIDGSVPLLHDNAIGGAIGASPYKIANQQPRRRSTADPGQP
jgi:hypothetical protein